MTIKHDDVFIYPTDTVWGIGCSLYSEKGHSEINEIKQTAKGKPLSIMFTSVQEIYQSFNFPEEINLPWLEEFFKLETTLGFPIKASKLKIPKWATGESEYVSIRCLQTDVTKKIYQDLKSPFFSTSLNITGDPPIVTSSGALEFLNTHAKNAHFVDSEAKQDLSGSSSTIIFFNEQLDFEIKREGLKIKEVKNHIMKLFEGIIF